MHCMLRPYLLDLMLCSPTDCLCLAQKNNENWIMWNHSLNFIRAGRKTDVKRLKYEVALPESCFLALKKFGLVCI